MMMYPSSPEAATRLLAFLNASPTPFHTVHNAAVRLETAGFRKLREPDNWDKEIKAGGKYYFIRNQAALVAFTLPLQWQYGSGLSIIATHVDSPNLRVRPVSKKAKAGFLQVGVETYGGGIWHSWLDPDSSGNFNSRLIKIDRPLLRIPTLAIHLDRNVNDSFKFNQETEFVPILGLIANSLNKSKDPADPPRTESKASNIQINHHSELLSVIAGELSVAPEEIHDFELSLYDTQPSVLGGIDNEFIFSPRLDNLFSSFCAVDAMCESISVTNLPDLDGNVNCIALFNHEEIGSVSMSGAESNLIPSLLSRLSPTPGALACSIAKSFLISCDMGHALHPNFISKHEENHTPRINGGVVIKTNAKQRYTSDAVSSFVVKQLIEKKGGKVQEYEVRNDMACGSTVGPHLSTIGMRTVDIGFAMLSMHSIRETAGSHDVQNAIDLFTSFFEGFAKLDKSLTVD
ncbi:peptidase M18 [Armillaria mellea]|nr:peptidase M18 [Armillaria mellea]